MNQGLVKNIVLVIVFGNLCRPGTSFQHYENPQFYNVPGHANLGMPPPHGGNMRQVYNGGDSMWPDSNEYSEARNFVTIENTPKKLKSNMNLQIRYQCTKLIIITLLIEGYENDDNLLRNSSNPQLVNDPTVFFQKSWQCSYTPTEMKMSIKIKLPKRFLYRPSLLMPKVSTLEDVKLKMFLAPMEEWNFIIQKESVQNKFKILFENSKLKFEIPLKTIPPMKRPKLKLKKSLSWQGKIIKKILEKQPLMTIAENECSDPIRYPTVMSEEPYGVILGYYPYQNQELQRMKLNKLRFTLSMEIFLFTYCESAKFCGLFQHLDADDRFETPLFLISNQGNLLIQMKATNNSSYAQSSLWTVPLRQWFRIHFVQTNTLTNVTVFHGQNYSEALKFVALFQQPLAFDDYKGYMVVGGTVYCRNINGIISFTKFCRNKALPYEKVYFPNVRNAIDDKILRLFKKQQQTLKKSIKSRWQHYSDFKKSRQDVSVPYFLEIIQNATRQKENDQSPAIHPLISTRLENVEEILDNFPSHLKSKDVLTQTKVALYKKFLEKLENPLFIKNTTKVLKFLKQSARLGDGMSHFLLYSIYKNGIGINRSLLKARFHLLLGAQLGDNLCLKALAYNHMNGHCGFPKDVNLGFFYFFNLAHKTQEDFLKHNEGQAMVNTARLTDEKTMKEQLTEGDDVFEWLKMQAAKGAFSAQRNMARLLYWGQQGLQRNLEAAIKYYEEAAKGGDPAAMYDYGLALVKGHGTEADMEKGIEVLKQAAEVENPSALNTLGWYYATEVGNLTKAVEYFEKSDKLGSIDAAYNLGHMYHMGQYPGKSRDMVMAFKKYYRAAVGGHTESILQVAYLTAIGVENFVPRNPYLAAQWAQYLTERNPTMGELVREGLQAFRKQQWGKALLIYMSVAETGFEVAQYNTAFLCETDGDEVVPHIQEECVWKNWNLTTQVKNPHPYGLNKMGDFHYYGHNGKHDLSKAIEYYREASRLNLPQALFNLANVMEEHGDIIGNETLLTLALPKEALQSCEDAIVYLYRRCTEIDSSESSLPCYIALLRTQLVFMWKRTSFFAKVLTFVIIAITTAILIILNMWRRKNNCNDSLSEERLENGFSSDLNENTTESASATDVSKYSLEASEVLEEHEQ